MFDSSVGGEKRWQGRLSDALALLLLSAAFGFGHSLMKRDAHLDPDRHFHLAISRMVSWWGKLDALPQAEDLGWANRFPDKEYLFHLFTGWGYRAGGEPGVDFVSLVFGFLVVAGVYALCRTATGPPVSYAFTLFGAVISPWFLFRISMLRPHVLAIGLALWLGVGLLSRKRWLTCVAAVTFTLAYHAFYVPLAIVGLFVLVNRRDRATWVTGALALGGLLLGTVINPYFPSNLSWGTLMLREAVSADTLNGLGGEVVPSSTKLFVARFLCQIIFCGIALGRPWWAPYPETQRRPVAFVASTALAFLALSLLTPRAAEYAVPFSACALAHAMADVRWAWRGIVLGGALLAQVPLLVRETLAEPREKWRDSAVVAAVAALPREAAGDKVMNCMFNEGEILLHLRPDVRFVDLLDSSLLEQAAPPLAARRVAFREGLVTDPLAVVRGTFRASYVLCQTPEVQTMLDTDPRFVRLSPPAGKFVEPGSTSALYAVMGTSVPSVRLFQSEGSPQGQTADLAVPANHDYLDLGKETTTGCMRLQVPKEELARFEGAELALVGGGPTLALEIDGVRVFETSSPLRAPRWNAELVPLRHELSSRQRVVIETCRASRRFFGAALSFWTRNEAKKRCEAVGWPLPKSKALVESERASCLAPVAVPADDSQW